MFEYERWTPFMKWLFKVLSTEQDMILVRLIEKRIAESVDRVSVE
jgi:hypothetical protein